MQFIDLEFVAEQFHQFADSDPVHWNSNEGAIPICGVLVFYKRYDDHFELDVEDIIIEVERP